MQRAFSFLTIVAGLFVAAVTCYGQRYDTISTAHTGIPDPRSLLTGKWHNEKDSKDIIVVDRFHYYELYGKDTDDVKLYRFSVSCNIKDSTRHGSSADLFLILQEKGEENYCNKILALDKKTFSWVSDRNGKIFVYNRMK